MNMALAAVKADAVLVHQLDPFGMIAAAGKAQMRIGQSPAAALGLHVQPRNR